MPPNVRSMVGDIEELAPEADDIFGDGFQVVLSDMAPATTGHKFSDAVRSFEL